MAMRTVEQLGFDPFSPRGDVPNSKQGEIMSSEVSTRRLIAATLLLALAFTSLIQTGCTRPIRRLGILDELAIAYRDRVWAQRAYNLRFANCNREYGDHFRNGFYSGYSDVSNGGDGYLPALPPDEYRGYEYQCAEGSKCVDTWFEGYPAGVAAAREEKAGDYHEMHVSRMIDQAITQDNTTNTLPIDVPVAAATSKMVRPRLSSDVPVKTFSEGVVASKQVSPASAKLQPQVHSILAKAPAPVATPRVAKVPPIIKATPKPSVNKPPVIVKAPPTMPKYSTLPVQNSVPPIVQGKPPQSTVKRPPIVRGRKIDPSANVSRNEIPLPMAVRSSFDTRTAAWPVNRR